MLDGQSSIYITQKLCIHVTFTSGDTHPVTFFVAPLDLSCEAVLGLDWLVTYNPLVDWTTCWLTFCATKQLDLSSSDQLTSTLYDSHGTTVVASCMATILPKPNAAGSLPAPVSFINAAAFYWAAWLDGSQAFYLSPSSLFL